MFQQSHVQVDNNKAQNEKFIEIGNFGGRPGLGLPWAIAGSGEAD